MKKLWNKTFTPMALFLCVVLIAVLHSGFVFLLFSILPSIIAYFFDYDRGRPSFKTVMACNLAAALPWLVPMFRAGIKMKKYDVSHIMNDPNAWLFIYCGALSGWGLIFLCRLFAKYIVSFEATYQLAHLEKFQTRLLKEWGQQVQQSSDA